jgi:hypothetical protein
VILGMRTEVSAPALKFLLIVLVRCFARANASIANTNLAFGLHTPHKQLSQQLRA